MRRTDAPIAVTTPRLRLQEAKLVHEREESGDCGGVHHVGAIPNQAQILRVAQNVPSFIQVVQSQSQKQLLAPA